VGSIERIRAVQEVSRAAQKAGNDVVVNRVRDERGDPTASSASRTRGDRKCPTAREMDAIARDGREQVVGGADGDAIQHRGRKAALAPRSSGQDPHGPARSRKARSRRSRARRFFRRQRRNRSRRRGISRASTRRRHHDARGGRLRHDGGRVAAGVGADACEIFTDVDGVVYTTEPERVSLGAARFRASRTKRCWSSRRSREGFANSKRGDCDEVRSSGSRSHFVQRVRRTCGDARANRSRTWVVAGIAVDKGEARVSLVGYEDKLGAMADLFGHIRGEKNFRRHDRPNRGHRIARPAPT